MKGRSTAALLLIAGLSPVHGETGPGAPFHFDHDIAPHLVRAGCAAAECHGGATGRGGFKLSLFATNGRADFEAITQELAGRRIDFGDPHRSLLLRKPTRQMKHGGGEVIARDDSAYLVLAKWITDGAPFARGAPGRLSELDLALRGDRATVRATFERPDGVSYQRDVSALSRFESTNERVASIDKSGLVTRLGPGEAWILARYGNLSARLAIVRSFGQGAGGDVPAGHQLDAAWLERLVALGLPPAPPAADHQLLRRLYLDLVGRPPAPDEIEAFFELPPEDRIARTADELLATDEFAVQLTRQLWTWFEVPVPGGDLRHTSERNERLRGMIREFAGRDASLMEFASSLFANPRRREFVQRFGDPRDRAEFTGRAMLGISIGCARCHNHPMDRWSQAQHLQFSAFFADARPASGKDNMRDTGTFFLPGDGKAVEPAFLPIAARPTPPAADASAQDLLVRFIRQDGADAFARNAANRLFGILTGRHLVDAPDDHRLSNPALHEPVLDLLAQRFRDSGYRLRPLVRFLVTSRLYGMDSTPPDPLIRTGDPQWQYLARREARAMDGAEFRRAATAVLGLRVEETETPGTPLARQLHILNGGLLQQWLRAPGNQVDAIFDFQTGAGRQLEHLYLLILSRPPRPAEVREFLPLLRDAADPREAGRDLAFALFASREFSSIR